MDTRRFFCKVVLLGFSLYIHRPEDTVLYQTIEQHVEPFSDAVAEQGARLPRFVREAFDAYLRCGRLEHGFIRAKCEGCRHEHLVAFSCKRRGFCPSCGVRRMAESAAHLLDHVLPRVPLRQWVLSFPWPLAGRKTMTRHETPAGVGARSGTSLTLVKPFTVARDDFSLDAALSCEAPERDKLERVAATWLARPLPRSA